MLKLIFTVLSSSIDSLNIGITFSLQNIKLNIARMIEISLFIFIMAFISISLSSFLAPFIPSKIFKLFGFLIFSWFAFLSYNEIKEKRNIHLVDKFTTPQVHDLNQDKYISFKEGALMSLTLALDTIIVSLTLSLNGFYALLAAFLFGFSNFLLLFIGTKIAKTKYLEKLIKKIEYLPTILFVILAITRLI